MIDQAVVLGSGAESSDGLFARTAGIPLVKRLILVLGRAGVRRVVVAAGTHSAEVSALVEGDRDIQASGIAVRVVEHAPAADGARVVLGTNRVIDTEVAKRLAGASVSATSIVSAVDGNGRTVGAYALGADVPAADALPTESTQTVDVGDAFWSDVSGPAERAATEAAMFRSLKKRVDGPISRLINRRVSISITKQLVNTNITPNQMTIVATIVGVAGVIATAQATWLGVTLGAFLVQMQSILDGCDGEIARLKLKSSRVGEWLDNVLDDQVNIGFAMALGYATSVLLGNRLWLWLGVGAGSAYLVHNAIFYLQLALVHRSGNPFNFRWWFERGTTDVTAMLQAQGPVARIGGFFRALIRRDVFLFGFFLLCAAHLPQVAVVWYSLVAASQTILILTHVVMGGPWKVR